MSDNEKTLFESEQQLSLAAAAQRLREVADGMEAGDLRLGGHLVQPASTVAFEEEYSTETDDDGITYEVELELKWSGPDGDGKGGQPASGRRGKFELFRDAAGKFRFRLKAGNGEIIASSEAYESKAAAQKGIKAVRTNASTATTDDQT